MLASLLFAAPAILPNDPRIVLVGRFERNDPAAPACGWPGCEVRMRVKGATVVATIEENGRDFWQVVVDGKPTATIAPTPGRGTYTLDLGVDAIHELSLVKRTEGSQGVTRFRGFDLPGGGLFQARRRPRLIEFVGDSITCAFGVEGASQTEGFRPETENAYLGYASVAARALAADVRLLAWSGRKMWPDNTMPEILDRAIPTRPTPLADPDEPTPDVVVINLATNDFAPGNPDEKEWTAAYEALVRREWAKNPKARVYATLGSMMTDAYPVGTRALSTARGYLTRMVARLHDPRLSFLEFEPQDPNDGYGSAWHPSATTQAKMADRLVRTLRRDMGW